MNICDGRTEQNRIDWTGRTLPIILHTWLRLLKVPRKSLLERLGSHSLSTERKESADSSGAFDVGGGIPHPISAWTRRDVMGWTPRAENRVARTPGRTISPNRALRAVGDSFSRVMEINPKLEVESTTLCRPDCSQGPMLFRALTADTLGRVADTNMTILRDTEKMLRKS